jgi:hypothetical protein
MVYYLIRLLFQISEKFFDGIVSLAVFAFAMSDAEMVVIILQSKLRILDTRKNFQVYCINHF